MISAFGVDHGYETVEKFSLGGGLGKLGAKLASGTQKAGIGLQNRGAGVLKQVKSTPHPNPKFNAGANKIGEGYLHTGGKIHQMGMKMASRPALTGGVAAGGAGAAGLGGVGSLLHRRNQ